MQVREKGKPGDVPQLDDRSLQLLRSRLRGQLVLPGDESYDAVRRVWNGVIDKRPGKHGLTCDNILAADIVTADGEFRQFWPSTPGAGSRPCRPWTCSPWEAPWPGWMPTKRPSAAVTHPT